MNSINLDQIRTTIERKYSGEWQDKRAESGEPGQAQTIDLNIFKTGAASSETTTSLERVVFRPVAEVVHSVIQQIEALITASTDLGTALKGNTDLADSFINTLIDRAHQEQDATLLEALSQARPEALSPQFNDVRILERCLSRNDLDPSYTLALLNNCNLYSASGNPLSQLLVNGFDETNPNHLMAAKLIIDTYSQSGDTHLLNRVLRDAILQDKNRVARALLQNSHIDITAPINSRASVLLESILRDHQSFRLILDTYPRASDLFQTLISDDTVRTKLLDKIITEPIYLETLKDFCNRTEGAELNHLIDAFENQDLGKDDIPFVLAPLLKLPTVSSPEQLEQRSKRCLQLIEILNYKTPALSRFNSNQASTYRTDDGDHISIAQSLCTSNSEACIELANHLECLSTKLNLTRALRAQINHPSTKALRRILLKLEEQKPTIIAQILLDQVTNQTSHSAKSPIAAFLATITLEREAVDRAATNSLARCVIKAGPACLFHTLSFNQVLGNPHRAKPDHNGNFHHFLEQLSQNLDYSQEQLNVLLNYKTKVGLDGDQVVEMNLPAILLIAAANGQTGAGSLLQKIKESYDNKNLYHGYDTNTDGTATPHEKSLILRVAKSLWVDSSDAKVSDRAIAALIQDSNLMTEYQTLYGDSELDQILKIAAAILERNPNSARAAQLFFKSNNVTARKLANIGNKKEPKPELTKLGEQAKRYFSGHKALRYLFTNTQYLIIRALGA